MPLDPKVTMHLVEGWGVFVAEADGFAVPGVWPQLWCRAPVRGDVQFVTEPLFSNCAACSAARTRAASALKPEPEPFPVNPHG